MKTNGGFFFSLTLFSVILFLAGMGIFSMVPELKSKNFPVLILFFLALTALVHVFLKRSAEGRMQAFINTYMALSGAKMFLCLFIMLVYGYLNKGSSKLFIGTFAALYLMYSAFEVVCLLRELRSKRAN